ncbi:peptidase, partial [candidate division KSB1 bacterium]|nr:peptidase [candidate division KSB1 bacterium]
RTAAAYDFCLYEYFNTDRIGHTQSVVEAGELLYQLEILILTAISNTDLEECLILLTSDHGNIEDSSVKTHTTNPVPLVAWGKRSAELISRSNSIQDVAHILLEFLA